MAMISIRQLLQGNRPAGSNEQRAETRLVRLLVKGLQARQEANWGTTPEFTTAAGNLLGRIEEAGALETDPLETACEALELFETHRMQASVFFQEQQGQLQSMVGMLTETIADISARTDASTAALQAIERQIRQASSLDDIRGLKTSLEKCLADFKEAAIQQQSAMEATVKRLHEQVRMSRPLEERTPYGFPGAPERMRSVEAEYAISFKLRRADHIRSRFGDGAIEQMFTLVIAGLKPAQRPKDRLMRWKRDSLLMFVTSREDIRSLRERLSPILLGIGRQHIEVGKNSALLGVGVDWLILSQAQYSTTERLFRDIDAFLNEKPKEGS